MFTGTVVSIHIASHRGQPLTTVVQVRALPGRGLEGDRYCLLPESAGEGREPGQEVTLIELEAIQALKREKGIDLPPGSARRNLVTRAVPLNHLVGVHFKVGVVVLRGVELAEPCHYLAGLTQPEVLPGLIHRGGLRAEIVTEGIIQAGDTVTLLD